MKSNLQTIREAVVKTLDPYWIDGVNAPNYRVYQILAKDADITLADVLRAIQKTGIHVNIRWSMADGFLYLNPDNDIEPALWNLAENLDDQDEPTKKSLAEILK